MKPGIIFFTMDTLTDKYLEGQWNDIKYTQHRLLLCKLFPSNQTPWIFQNIRIKQPTGCHYKCEGFCRVVNDEWETSESPLIEILSFHNNQCFNIVICCFSICRLKHLMSFCSQHYKVNQGAYPMTICDRTLQLTAFLLHIFITIF